MSTATSDVPSGVTAAPEAHTTRGLYAWFSTVDHKKIGILYLVTALFFFAIGGTEALVIRLQLARPNNTLVSPDTFNQLFTMHGTTMIFLVVMPTLVGFANYLVPLMIGARDMAFPRMNALAYWLYPLGGFLLHFSMIAGGAPSAGWFGYAPLSETPYSSSQGTDYWIVALLVLGVASVASAINIIATILTLRTPGMSIRRLPLFVWMTFVTSIVIILALPVLNAALAMLLIDRQLEAHFFSAVGGGNAILWQHFFWTFGHPEVYIMALPAFGMISEIIPVFSRKPIFGYGFVAASTVAIAILSFGVWAHHMFAAGMGHRADLAFAISSMAIAIPTGVKIFNWIATMWSPSLDHVDALRHRVPPRVRHRRAERHHLRGRADRLASDRHVLPRRPLPLRALRRNGFCDLRGDLLLVSQDERPPPGRAVGTRALLAHGRRLQPHFLRAAFPRHHGNASPRLHVS
jgi:cytochrome c oxidase subunit 1/cytochrome c oxidase subunit I+III